MKVAPNKTNVAMVTLKCKKWEKSVKNTLWLIDIY